MPSVSPIRAAAAAASLAVLAPSTAWAEPAAPEPFRLSQAIGQPWIHVSLAHRQRYAYLFDQFRAGRPGDGGTVSLRTNLLVELKPRPVRFGVEILDSRAYFDNDVTAPDTTIVNPVEPLQAYAAVDLEDVFADKDTLRMQVGRMTMDVGSRRLVARNAFRNTINSFLGVDVEYGGDDGPRIRAFGVLPTERRPAEPDALDENEIELDRESFDVLLAGLWAATPPLASALVIEGYVLGLVESDGDESPTRNRRLVTPGSRVRRAPKNGAIDIEIEIAAQVGTSRASAAPDDAEDLDHLAAFQHAALGYTFDVAWSPRVAAAYDFASGDASSDDGNQGRFDTLYGARAFDFGPTGIYGAFARGNIRSPGAKLSAKPHAMVQTLVGYRAAWLAEARDAWTTSGVRDPTGASGTFIGQQVELQVNIEPIPGNLRLDIGGAHLFPGAFVDNAPNANVTSATTYLYSQLTGTI